MKKIKIKNNPPQESSKYYLSEDWFSVLLAFLLILLAVIGVLGENGLPIVF